MFEISEAHWRADVRCPDCGRMGLEFEGCIICPDDACDVVEIAPMEMRLSTLRREEIRANAALAGRKVRPAGADGREG